MIVSAAIRLDGKIYTLPMPARHNNVIHYMVHECGIKPPFLGEQGFIDSKEGFVNRKEAWIIAKENKQIRENCETAYLKELFSEDIW